MKKLIVAVCLFIAIQPAYALLSPLYQSIHEISTILQSPELEKYLPQGRPILEIQRMGNGYMVHTQELELQIEMEYLPLKQPGRQEFKLLFHEATHR